MGSGLQHLDAFHGGQLLRHGSAQFLNRLPDLLTDLLVGGIRQILADDALTAELLLGLGGPEQVGGQLGAPHVVEELLPWVHLLAGMDLPGAEATIEPHVAMVLEDGIIHGPDYACVPRGISQVEVMLPQFRPDGEAPLILHALLPLLRELLPAGLGGEVGLPGRDNLLGRVGILDDEVTGIS